MAAPFRVGLFALFFMTGLLLPAQTLYWDIANGSGTGATPTGTWDTVSKNWNSSASGSGQAGVWTNGNTAVFSAGTSATGSYNVTISGSISATGITSEEGTPTITGGTLALTGTGTINTLTNLTINSAITGSVGLTKTGSAILTLGGANTYTGVTTVSGGTLQAGVNQAFSGGLDLSGATLALNGKSVTVGVLNITGASTIDFGNASASSLTVTTLNFDVGATLTITNWANAVDFFYATNFTGATVDSRGTGAAVKILFNGPGSGINTLWQNFDKQITPVPEPSTYGLLFLMLSTCCYVWHRRSKSSNRNSCCC